MPKTELGVTTAAIGILRPAGSVAAVARMSLTLTVYMGISAAVGSSKGSVNNKQSLSQKRPRDHKHRQVA